MATTRSAHTTQEHARDTVAYGSGCRTEGYLTAQPNKFLGDGALAVFGAPNDLADHADAAVNSAVLIHRLVAERFGGALRIGIGINTGVVIAGTIGGGSKLEFIPIGDTVNVAARVEPAHQDHG